MVASTPMPSRMRRASARAISAKLDDARSLMPASLEIPADSRASRIAAASSVDSTLSLAPSANCASASDLASPILPSAARKPRRTNDSSIVLAMKMVQVSSEAKASPIMTALTRISADMNIDHGDNSRSVGAAGFGGVTLSASAAVVPEAVAAGADEGAAGWAIIAGRCAGATGCCWASASEANATTADAASNLRTILNIAASVLCLGEHFNA
jgi:hypothetical protein